MVSVMAVLLRQNFSTSLCFKPGGSGFRFGRYSCRTGIRTSVTV